MSLTIQMKYFSLSGGRKDQLMMMRVKIVANINSSRTIYHRISANYGKN